MLKYESRQDLANKIDWEGGIPSALSYGIDALSMPEGDEELRAAWEQLDEVWVVFEDACEQVLSLLQQSE